MWRLDGWLDPEAGLIVSTALESLTRKPDPHGSDAMTESPGHRRAEALTQLARHATAHTETCGGHTPGRDSIILGLPHQSLLDRLGVPSATTNTPPPGFTHPTPDHPSAANADPSSDPPPKPHGGRDPRAS